jgi:GT2 family glycosyltransferase
MRATIVIPAYNEGALLAKTIGACLETAADVGCEIAVADDASDDGSIEEVQRQFPKVRIFSHAVRRGVSVTKDLGARNSRGDVLVFLDGHCKPEPGAIASLIADIENWDGEAIVSPRIAALNTKPWENCLDQVGYGYRIDLESFELSWVDLPNLEKYGERKGKVFYSQPTLIGCCVAMSRRLYEKLWGWDTGMRVYGAEDVDFGLKAWLMGHPVLHDPEPLIGHRFGGNIDSSPDSAEHHVANQLRMARKNFTDSTWLDWMEKYSFRQPPWVWESAWKHFLEGNECLERERAYLMANRAHDEFWYAATFGLSWPVTMATAATSSTSTSPDKSASGPASPPPQRSSIPTLLGYPRTTRPPARSSHPPMRSPSPHPERSSSPPPKRSPSPHPP